MSREVDRRDPSVNRLTPEREAALHMQTERVAGLLPGQGRPRITRFDPLTGNPATITFDRTPGRASRPPSAGGLLALPVADRSPAEPDRAEHPDDAGASATPAELVQRALELVRGLGPSLGLLPGQSTEYAVSSPTGQASSGARAVHLQQEHLGLPIFEMTETVIFGPDDTAAEISGHCVTLPPSLSAIPTLPVEEAVLLAAQHVAAPDGDEIGHTDPFGQPVASPTIELAGFTPRVIATFSSKSDRPTVLEAGPFGAPIAASLRWFPLGDTVRLAWDVRLVLPEDAGRFRVLVDATDGSILYAHRST